MLAHLPAGGEAEPSTMEVMNRQEETGQLRDTEMHGRSQFLCIASQLNHKLGCDRMFRHVF